MSYSICIVSQQYRSVISGIGVHTRNLLTGLHQHGHTVTLLTQSDQCDHSIPPDIKVITVPSTFFQKSQARWIPLAWYFARALRQLAAMQRFDLIHFTDAREALLFAGCHPAVIGNVNDYYAAELRSFSYYRRYYADAGARWIYYLLVNRCERVTFRRLNAVIANSEYTCQAIQRSYLVDSRRIFKCFKCIDLGAFKTALRDDYSSGLVLFVGGNMQRKGLGVLIQAAPRVIAGRPDVKFIVVGSDPNLGKMQKMCRTLGVENHFEFVGWVPNDKLRNLYYSASVFVMPSLMEAFGVAILEAMAAGTPVVATKVGGIPELIQSGENGLLVEPDDPEGLADALLLVLKDSSLAARLGRGGQATATHFGIEQMLECTYRVYETVVDKSS